MKNEGKIGVGPCSIHFLQLTRIHDRPGEYHLNSTMRWHRQQFFCMEESVPGSSIEGKNTETCLRKWKGVARKHFVFLAGW
jgi:hypothetical protein